MKKLGWLVVMFLSLEQCAFVDKYSSVESDIRLNQIGYLTLAKKQAVVVEPQSDSFNIVDAKGEVVFSGRLLETKLWDQSGEQVALADFTNLVSPGQYRMEASGVVSPAFAIGDHAYNDIIKAAAKAFYYNRASTDLEPEYAGKYARKSGHPDTAVIIHASASSENRTESSVISTPYGWYDAGDYNKYVVNSGIATYTMLLSYEHYAAVFDTLNWNIPESNNQLPDLLDETLWNLKWLITMQDPYDGGVYHKTTTASFEGFISPSEARNPRYVVSKSTAATLDFSAVLAKASVILRESDPELATHFLSSAEKAWKWASVNPNVPFKNPGTETSFPAISTGAYGDTKFDDEFLWAAVELYLATGNATYMEAIDLDKYDDYLVPDWKNTASLGLLSLVSTKRVIDEKLRKKALNYLMVLSESLMSTWYHSPYRITLNEFRWGSNAQILNQSLVLLNAYKSFGNSEFFEAALSALDYVLGKNATGYCFVTGFGTRSPQNIHHRPSASDMVDAPIPGFLVGGPNPRNVEDDCGRKKYPVLLPARCFIDEACSYSTNEVAINWNAPLVYVVSSIQHIYNTEFIPNQ